MSNDCYETIDNDSDMYQSLDSILIEYVKFFEMEMLLDPLEEEFDSLPTFIKECHVFCRNDRIVGADS